jgi:hypothetical protein
MAEDKVLLVPVPGTWLAVLDASLARWSSKVALRGVSSGFQRGAMRCSDLDSSLSAQVTVATWLARVGHVEKTGGNFEEGPQSIGMLCLTSATKEADGMDSRGCQGEADEAV